MVRTLVYLTLVSALVVVLGACSQSTLQSSPNQERQATQSTARPADTNAQKPEAKATAAPAAKVEQPPSKPATGSAKASQMKIGAPMALGTAPILVALEKGYFAEQGIDATFENVPTAPNVVAMVAAGQLQAGLAAGAALFNGLARGVDVKIMAANEVEAIEGKPFSALVVRKDLYDSGAIKKVQDLRGRKIAVVAFGSIADWFLEEKMRPFGVTNADLDLVLMAQPDTVTALQNKSIDGGLLFEPFASQAIGGGVAVELAPGQGAGAQGTLEVVNSRMLKDNPDLAVRYLIAYLKAVRDLSGNGWAKDENARILEKFTKVPVDIIKRSGNPYFDPNGRINMKSFQRQQEFFMQRGFLEYKTLLNVADFVDYGPLDQALKTVGEIKNWP